MLQGPIVVLDNGASTIKGGVVSAANGGDSDVNQQSRLIPNTVIRSKGDRATYVGHEVAKCRDYTSLHYRLPCEKGLIVDWDAQKAIWDGLFLPECLGVDTTQSSLLITEPYFNLPNIQETYDQFVFEEYEFRSYHRCTPASLIPYGKEFEKPGLPASECMLVVDSGFSFTHVVPILKGEVIWNAVKRLDVGGKLLTNQLKELVSFRQWNMMDETYIMNQVKEACCFVSNDFKQDLEACRADARANRIVQEYILPDLAINRPGRVRQPQDIISDSDQILYMNNERFTVPEIIFHPDDIGLHQAGLPSVVAMSISQLPEDLQGMFWGNIILMGGNTMFSGFRQRLANELRTLAPVDCLVEIYESSDPISAAYKSAVAFTSQSWFFDSTVTKADYQEYGSNACIRKFKNWRIVEDVEQDRPRDRARSRPDASGPVVSTKKVNRTRSKSTLVPGKS